MAGEYFGNGYHCAEAVVRAVIDSRGEAGEQVVPYATAFGGGFGETFSQACGVISGSLLIIGHHFGRRCQGDSWQEASRLGRATVEHFGRIHGICSCGQLRERFGEEDQMMLCREVVMRGAAGIVALLNKEMTDDNQ